MRKSLQIIAHRNVSPILSLMEMTVCVLSHSVMSDSLRPHGLCPARLLCPWNFPGKNTGVGCHFLLLGIFPEMNPCLLCLLHWQTGSLPLCHLGSPNGDGYFYLIELRSNPVILSSAFLKTICHRCPDDDVKSFLKKVIQQKLLLSFLVQRKAKEQEERTMEQERINEGLKELNCEERENFTRYGFVFFIITT